MTPIEVLKERVAVKLEELNLSAREVSLAATGQPAAIRNILSKNAMPRIDRLDAIAAALGTTSDWLLGREVAEHQDAQGGNQAAIVHVMMQVAMPSRSALEAMFKGLLRGVDLTSSRDDIARQLADMLPIGLAQLEHLLPEHTHIPQPAYRASAAASGAKRHPEPQS